ncbi:MAG: ELWxxDGT repeat protein, partial [Candidatus Poseidoniaceae archaeon]
MRSESHASPMKAMFLAILMVMMVQTGYMDIWNNSVSNDSSLDEATPKESGASGNSLIPSSLGADLMVDEMIGDITFRYKEDYNGNGTAWMVKDIHDKNSLGNHPTLGHSGGHVTSLMTMNDILYFPAQDIEDNELWRSDGTESGTYMVKNIRSNYSYGTGPSYLNQSQPRSIVNYGNNIYFRALGDSGGFELWKSDGTESGTVMAKDIEPGPPGSNPYYLELAGDVIYMRARSSNYGEELYAFDISNGTSWLVKDINSGSADSGIDTIFAIGSSVYFSATDGIHGEELWKSDGTSSGTFMVKDINTGGALSNGSYPHDFATLDGNLFFVAYDGTSNAYAVWKSDGTASGTVILKNNSDNIKINGNYIHFKDGDGKLWRSDGTITETVLITDNHSVYDFYPTNDSIYIVERTLNPTIYSLWKFDKTNSGFKELVTGFSSMSQLFTIEDTLYFKGDDGTHGDELWRSDGTIAGTVLATDIANGSDGSNIGLNFEFANHNPWKAQKIGNTLYFTADDRVHDKELWAYDLGTNLASYEVTGSTCTISPTLPTGLNFDTGSCTISGTPSVVTSNTTYTVTANISGTDYQSTIWLSSAYRQLTPSAEGADLMVGNVMGDITFQYNASAASGSGSGSGSGSNSGTYNGNGTAWMVKDIRSGSSSSSPNYFTAVGNTLYFVTNDGTNGVELWKSDGTASGTVMVKDINSGGNSNPEYLTAVGNTVYFQADDGINGEELWKSDGTSAGTVMVKDI